MKNFERGSGGGSDGNDREDSTARERIDVATRLLADTGEIERNLKREYPDPIKHEEKRDQMIAEGRLAPQELLKLTGEIALEINALHLDGYLSRPEAEELIEQLQLSRGRDNTLTMAIMMYLGERRTTKRLDELDGSR